MPASESELHLGGSVKPSNIFGKESDLMSFVYLRRISEAACGKEMGGDSERRNKNCSGVD